MMIRMAKTKLETVVVCIGSFFLLNAIDYYLACSQHLLLRFNCRIRLCQVFFLDYKLSPFFYQTLCCLSEWFVSFVFTLWFVWYPKSCLAPVMSSLNDLDVTINKLNRWKGFNHIHSLHLKHAKFSFRNF